MSKPMRYVGMTGFSSSVEVEKVLKDHEWDPSYLVMLGVLASDKSLASEELDQPKRYPKREALGEIFPDREGVLNLLHINAPREALFSTMLEARELAGPHCHGVQVNKTWPEPEVFKDYLNKYPGDTLVLQCGAKAIESAEKSKLKFEAQVAEYKGLAKYVLIDPSGGTGTPFDVQQAQWCFEALQELPFGLAIAGGLSSSQLHKLHKLKMFWPFSFDVESGIRNPADNLVVHFARNYLKVADTLARERLDRYSQGSHQSQLHDD